MNTKYSPKRFKQIEKLIKKLRFLQFEGKKEDEYHNLLLKVRRFKKYLNTLESDCFNRNVDKTINYMM